MLALIYSLFPQGSYNQFKYQYYHMDNRFMPLMTKLSLSLTIRRVLFLVLKVKDAVPK